jgi:hypothetical protein
MVFCSCVSRVLILKRVLPIVSLLVIVGCQSLPANVGDRMAAHVANIDFSGLCADKAIIELNVRAAVPHGWDPMPLDQSPLYIHQQWRSPAHTTGVGVAFIHMPLPMSAKTLVWFARTQYSRLSAAEHKPDAEMLGEWTDSLGREWFEGENTKYHVKGYVVTSGLNAWAVYSGYRLRNKPNAREISLAFRSMDSIVPLPLATAGN